MAQEPQIKRGASATNPYVDRWRWWYAAISDFMLDNPGCKVGDIATHLGKHVNTISMITNTDLFRDYHAQRRQEAQQARDFSVQHKLGEVAGKGLDLMLEVMNKKGDQVPLTQLVALTNTALENLGYGKGAAPPTTVVNVQQNANTQVVPVSAEALAEARVALRKAEAKRLEGAPLSAPLSPAVEVLSEEAENGLPSNQ